MEISVNPSHFCIQILVSEFSRHATEMSFRILKAFVFSKLINAHSKQAYSETPNFLLAKQSAYVWTAHLRTPSKSNSGED